MRLFGVKPIVQPNSSRIRIVNDYYKNWTDYMGKNYMWWLLPVLAVEPSCDGYNWQMYPKA